MIPHHSVIANVIQMKQHVNRHDANKPTAHKMYAPGDRMLGGTLLIVDRIGQIFTGPFTQSSHFIVRVLLWQLTKRL